MTDLKKEFQWYLDHQNELVKKYNGKVLVIKNFSVIGFYDSEIDAIEKTTTEHALGTFIVQKCSPGKNDYTMSFHSRVTFV